MTPKISLVAFEDRQGNFIFVSVPDQRGRYVRTDPCVALVACPACGSSIGEPCKANHNIGYTGSTHADRRILTDGRRRRGKPLRIERADIVDFNNDGANISIKTGSKIA